MDQLALRQRIPLQSMADALYDNNVRDSRQFMSEVGKHAQWLDINIDHGDMKNLESLINLLGYKVVEYKIIKS